MLAASGEREGKKPNILISAVDLKPITAAGTGGVERMEVDIMNGSEIVLHKPAPDFELAHSQGRHIRLSAYRAERHGVLMLQPGFI